MSREKIVCLLLHNFHQVVSERSNQVQTECLCNHLTNFGLIFDTSGALANWGATELAILNVISTVFLALSCLASCVTFVILQISK